MEKMINISSHHGKCKLKQKWVSTADWTKELQFKKYIDNTKYLALTECEITETYVFLVEIQNHSLFGKKVYHFLKKFKRILTIWSRNFKKSPPMHLLWRNVFLSRVLSRVLHRVLSTCSRQ